MREIKFRAYHKIRKEMYNVHGWHSEYVFKDTLDGVGCEGNPDKLDDVELMQFTGLKDKNGVDIYEGDIIKCPVSINKHIHGDFTNRVVKWKQDSFTWVFDSPFSWGRFEDNLTGEGYYIKYTEEGVIVLIEIIGNIYQDKHLIS